VARGVEPNHVMVWMLWLVLRVAQERAGICEMARSTVPVSSSKIGLSQARQARGEAGKEGVSRVEVRYKVGYSGAELLFTIHSFTHHSHSSVYHNQCL
jgi:hypothetical protein